MPSARLIFTDTTEVNLELKFDSARHYYLRIPLNSIEETMIPEIFVNRFRRNKHLECQTLELIKFNQKIKDAHNECISLSDSSIQELISTVRTKIQPLYKISESLAMLDLLSTLAHLVTTGDYVKPEFTDTLAIKSGRHPIHERVHPDDKFVPNDVYSTGQNRFQVITGCNMSGKSTYIRSIALTTIMAQMGSFVPASYASFPLFQSIFARISTDDTNEANVSTFSSEMREIAFILHNVTSKSLIIIDELGRGTSTTDGLAIAIAVAEALIESKAYVWFVTHFRDLPRILAERAGVVNLHLAVDMTEDFSKMHMRYRILDGLEEQRFYGLVLARVVGLPSNVVETATKVSQALHERLAARRSHPRALAVARKRKLLLNLKEQLEQARQSQMEGPALRDWLKRLQDEFLIRMRAIFREAAAHHLQTSGFNSDESAISATSIALDRETNMNDDDSVEIDEHTDDTNHHILRAEIESSGVDAPHIQEEMSDQKPRTISTVDELIHLQDHATFIGKYSAGTKSDPLQIGSDSYHSSGDESFH